MNPAFRTLLSSLFFLVLAGCTASADDDGWVPRTGDIVFQESTSTQSAAVAAATRSRWTHIGVLFVEGDGVEVFEAVQPVGARRFDAWVASGRPPHRRVVVKRLPNAGDLLTPAVIERMRQLRLDFSGRDYDGTFGWSDDRLYCSELVWKLYDRAAGLQLGRLARLGDFDLDNPVVKKKLRERYGTQVPLDEIVISPGSIFDDPRLQTVYSR